MALSPAADDPNRAELLKQKAQDPAAWGDHHMQAKKVAAELADAKLEEATRPEVKKEEKSKK